MILKQIFTLAFLIVVCIIVLSIYVFYTSIHPRRHISDITPANFGLIYENVSFKTEDDILLKGWFISSPNSSSAIIVCHGYPFNKSEVLCFAPFLQKKHNLLYFDFRGLGESGGKYTSIGYYEKNDVTAAVRYLKEREIKNIGGIGFSLGAAVLIMVNNPDIKAIVADSSYAALGMMLDEMLRRFYFLKYPFTFIVKILSRLVLKMDLQDVSPAAAIKNVNTPILIIHGENDTEIPVENAILLHQAKPEAECRIFPEAGHGEAYFLDPQGYEKKVLEFFEKHLH